LSDLDKRNNAAAVENNEATSAIMDYPWEENIVLTDFPGLNSIPLKDYINLVTEQSCDIYIIMHDALHENDIKMAKLMFNELKKQFFFCRSLTDKGVETILDYAEEKREEMNEQEAFEKHKKETLNVFENQKFNSYYDNNFTKELCKKRTFCVCCKLKNFRKYDWNDLIKEIRTLINEMSPEIARQFAINSPFLTDKRLLREKREALEKRIVPLSVASGITDFVPVGGVIADIIIIVDEVKRYRDGFGLTKDLFKEAADSVNFDQQVEKRQNIMEIIGIDSFYINIKNLVLTILSGLSVPAGVAFTKLLIASTGPAITGYNKKQNKFF